ncbi:MAG: CDP-diacylglycerol--glycerol-3-phosphate 3-phosphatidyltransferase [Clostridia bacterium]|nr:CDP-diacylglycerol--glycerol-3-phosphate 3-phosphatidyltransferase [Clostridia bacterium]
MNTPNKITLSRLLLIPLIVFFYLADFIPYGKLVSTIIFVIACLTDFLDGYLARKNNQVTLLGKFFDSIADKVLITTGLLLIVCPTPQSVFPVVYPSWLGVVCIVIILAREFIVSALRQVAAAKGTILAADKGGKIKATVQYIAVTLYMVFAFIQQQFLPNMDYSNAPQWVSIVRFVLMAALVAATLLTIYSGASYLIRNRHVFKEAAAVKDTVKVETFAQVETAEKVEPVKEDTKTTKAKKE